MTAMSDDATQFKPNDQCSRQDHTDTVKTVKDQILVEENRQ